MHRRLIQLARGTRLALIICIVCGGLAGLCSLLQAYALSTVVDGAFLGGQTVSQMRQWLGWLLAIIFARGLLLGIQEVAASDVAVRVKQDLRQRLFAHMLRLAPPSVAESAPAN